MSSVTITPIKTAGMVAPILRPLPTLFAYARVTAAAEGKTAQVLDDEFNANLRALAAIVEKAGKEAGIPDAAWRTIGDRCVAISGLRGADLATGLDKLCAELTALHKEHGKALRKAVAADQDGFRDLYRKTAPAKNVVILSTGEAPEQVESLERKLGDRCYYSCQTITDDWTNAPLGEADMVIFAPSLKPIAGNIMAVLDSYKLPFLILMGGDKSEDMQNMALMKSEYLYRKSGYNVLRSPFNPPRLYQTIDSLYMRHLGSTVLPIPVVKTAAAAMAKAAEGGLS